MDKENRLRIIKMKQSDTIVYSELWWYYEHLIDKLEEEMDNAG